MAGLAPGKTDRGTYNFISLPVYTKKATL